MGKPTPISDEQIVELYWQRSESAVSETAAKYGAYCLSIADRILMSREDAEESVNDTWLDAWNCIPPHRPERLSTFLGKITRRISIDRWRKSHAGKRGGGQLELALDELEDCLSDSSDVETTFEQKEAERMIADFLNALPAAERRVFLRRYWYFDSIAGIAQDFGFTESKTASLLYRTRKKLREKLESEGIL